jgi:hypothetical protein
VRGQLWDAWSQGHLRTACVVMSNPPVQDAAQVMRRQWYKKVQALSPQHTEESLAEGIRLRSLWWRFHDSEPQVADALVKLWGEDAVPVMDQEALGVVTWERFAQLLERPLGCRMRGHIDVEETARGMLHQHKHVE